MTLWHEKSFRRASGGIRNSRNRASKYLNSKGGEFAETTLNEAREAKIVKGRGSTQKTKLRKADMANVTNPSTKKTEKMKIIWVHENQANRLYVRRNIITKGTLLEVEKNGSKMFARVTNRPGQAGAVSAILAEKPVEKEKKTKAVSKAKPAPKKKEAKAQ